MDKTPIEMPTSWWERLRADKRRLALVLTGVSVVTLAVLGVLVAQYRQADNGPAARDVPVGSLDGTVTMPSTGQPVEMPGGDANGPEDEPGVENPGDTPGGSGGDEEPAVPDEVAAVKRAPFIAYRLDGSIWVSGEDGSQARAITESSDGGYALSPDGTVLAVVEGGELALIGVSDGSRTVVGPAEPRNITWHPDSSAVLFLRAVDGSEGVTDVLRVGRTGGGATKVMQADGPVVALDGTVVARPNGVDGPASEPVTGDLWVARPGVEPRLIAAKGPVADCTVLSGRIVYAVSGMACIDAAGETLCEPDIRTMALDGHGDTRLVGPPSSTRPFGYDELMISPDGKRLLYAETGDDGYSRTWMVALGGGAPTALTVRRDTYPVGWSADGTSVFFIEGNAFQGEVTSLMKASFDGTGRRVLVEGAAR